MRLRMTMEIAMSVENKPGKVEMSRLVTISNLDRRGKSMEATADNAEMAALGRRFELVAVKSLAAEITIKRGAADHTVHLSGNLVADVIQSCVVTLEPVDKHVEGVIDVIYSTDAAASWSECDMAPDRDVAPGEDDLPELLLGDEIDIGEVIAEHLGLHLDPYPRSPDAVFPSPADEPVIPDDTSRVSPFAILRDLKSD